MKRGMLEQLQVNHWPPLQPFNHYEQPQQQGASDQPSVGQRVAPADPVRLDQAPDQAQQTRTERQAAPGIEACGLSVAGLRHGAPDHHHQEHSDGQVKVENPAPAHVFGDQPADRRRGGHRHPHARAPERPGLGPFHFIVKGVADGGEGRGQQQGRADTLDRPGDVEEQRIGRGTATDGRKDENAQPTEQGFLPAEAVGNAASRQQKSGEGQHVSADDPFDVGKVSTQVAGDRGQGDGDNVGVENDQRANA
ncbi:hypothetical protein ABH912_000346 [Pseudomonas sp. BT76 TE3572]